MLSSSPTLSRDEGGQKLSVSSGPARGGHGEPDSSFAPRSTKKHHGMCPLEGGPPSTWASSPWGATGESLLALVWPMGLLVTGPQREVYGSAESEGQQENDCSPVPRPSWPHSALAQASVPPVRPAGHDSDSDSELSLDEQSSSYASSHSSDSEDDGVEAEDKWDSARGPVHSTPKGEPVLGCGVSEGLSPGMESGGSMEGPRVGGAAGTRAPGGRCWLGGRPVHSICRAEAGRPWRVSLGTLTSRTPRSWSRLLLGAPVLRLQDVEGERGIVAWAPLSGASASPAGGWHPVRPPALGVWARAR